MVLAALQELLVLPGDFLLPFLLGSEFLAEGNPVRIGQHHTAVVAEREVLLQGFPVLFQEVDRLTERVVREVTVPIPHLDGGEFGHHHRQVVGTHVERPVSDRDGHFGGTIDIENGRHVAIDITFHCLDTPLILGKVPNGHLPSVPFPSI